MLMINLLGIILKYCNLCTFSCFLVKLLLLIKTAQLTVRSSLNRPPPRFSLQEPLRARFIPESHDVPVDEGFPGLLPYLYLLEIDQALTVAALMPSNLFKPAPQKGEKERGGEGRKRERGLGREGKGLPLPFPFARFSPSPPLPSPVLRLPPNF